MRWLITGAGGQLGSDLRRTLSGPDGADEVQAVTRAELDVTDAAAVDKVVAEYAPDVIVNAAAYTAVDAAESDEPAAYLVERARTGGPRRNAGPARRSARARVDGLCVRRRRRAPL